MDFLNVDSVFHEDFFLAELSLELLKEKRKKEAEEARVGNIFIDNTRKFLNHLENAPKKDKIKIIKLDLDVDFEYIDDLDFIDLDQSDFKRLKKEAINIKNKILKDNGSPFSAEERLERDKLQDKLLVSMALDRIKNKQFKRSDINEIFKLFNIEFIKKHDYFIPKMLLSLSVPLSVVLIVWIVIISMMISKKNK